MKDENVLLRENFSQAGILTVLAIIIHNIPEGITTFIGAIEGTKLGCMLTISVALHDIPEGVAIATKFRLKAFLWTFLSGLVEPLGGLICWRILHNRSNVFLNGVLFGLVTEMMITISIKELIPSSYRFC